ncbi:MAG: hypothetical protein ACQERC_08215 [Bacteroidota bacterium]
MKRLFLVTLIATLLMLVFTPEVLGQCSQCKLLAEQNGEGIDAEILGGNEGNNINTAILYIMAVPYIILSILFRKQIKRFFQRTFSKQS